jgi:hypothetical protein
MKIVKSEGNDNRGNQGVCQRANFKVRRANKKLGRGRFEENKVQFSISNRFGKLHQAGHQESGEDLLDELIGRDKNDHLGAAPTRDGVDVLVNDIDKSELKNEPGQFHDHPDKKICPEGEFASCGVPKLDQPKANKMKEGTHLIRLPRYIF